VTATQFTLPRVAGDLSVGIAYNSLSRADGSSFVTSISSGWRLSTGSDVYLRREPTTLAVVFYGPNGTTGTYFPTGATTYQTPAGFKADLVKETTGWTLTDHGSGQVMVFGAGGNLTQLKDRNGNITTFSYNYASLTGIVTDQGTTGARTLTVTPVVAGDKAIAEISQGASGSLPARSAS
jgi:YD repeat-containing protein